MQQIAISAGEAILRGAQDGLFFSHFFLPKTFKLEPAVFHGELWDTITAKENRYVCIEVARDGAKTTIARAFTLQGISYGIYRTILFLSESRGHARRSLRWIKRRVQNSRQLQQCFHLQIGEVDNADELVIVNPVYGTTTHIIAQGITGQIRGINEDDERPDLIVCDDIESIENASSEDVLEKINQTFFGAVVNSLAARSINPYAKILNLGTRCGEGDVIGKCQEDEQWICRKFSIFTEDGESAWPAKWSTDELKKDKQSAISRNQLSVWLREKECKLIRSETTSFVPGSLLFHIKLPDRFTIFLGIDPVPPPTARQIATNLKKKDSEVISAVALCQGKFYIEEQWGNKGHEVDWTILTFLNAIRKWKPRACGVETIAYQATLATLLIRAMQRERIFMTQLVPIADRRKKFYRISDELGPLAINKALYVREDNQHFITQFVEYPGCQHDDYLDSVCMAIMAAKELYGYLNYQDVEGDPENDPYTIEYEKSIPDLPPRVDLCP